MEGLRKNKLFGVIVLILVSCNVNPLKTRDKFTLSKINSVRLEDLLIDSSENKLIGVNKFNWKTKNKYVRFWVQVNPGYFICTKQHKHYRNKETGYRGPDEFLENIHINKNTSFLVYPNKSELLSIRNFENAGQRFTTFTFVKDQWKRSFVNELVGDLPEGTICFLAYKDSLRKYSRLNTSISLQTSKKILVYNVTDWEY